MGIKNIYGVINRVRGDLIMDKEMLSIEDVYELLQIKIIGAVPDDDCVSSVSSIGGAVTNKCGASRAFELIAENVANGSSKIYDCTMNYRGVFGLIKRKLKRKI